MSENKPLKCQKCGKPLGYIALTPNSILDSKPDLNNVRLVGTCIDCRSGRSYSLNAF